MLKTVAITLSNVHRSKKHQDSTAADPMVAKVDLTLAKKSKDAQLGALPTKSR
jgi:hypothetical protein